MPRGKNVLIFVGIIALVAASAVFVYPKGWGASVRPWRLGLDLVGGAHLVYEIDLSKVEAADADSVLSGLRDVLERRVNLFGVSEPQVFLAKEGDSQRLVVELAGIKDVAQAVDQIGRTARLEFRTVSGEGEKATLEESGLTGQYLVKAQVTFNQTTGQPEISLQFNSEGATLFERITGENVGKPLAILVDGELRSAPTVQQQISGGQAVISGIGDLTEAQNLANLLNAGALPAPVTLLSQQTVSATLGSVSLERALYAGLIGTLLIIAFMLLYYRALGFFAAVALVFYVILATALFKTIPITMSLAGIAGFILSIGMAVDANVLIFERTKEEFRKGLSHASAVSEGFRRAWPSIRDSNISTILTAIILYYATSSFVRGFALTLLLGVLMSMFSAITITRTMLALFVKK
ncbi:MAG: protein-export membrane protein SecD [Candidatus Liptonbacteria bacterium RIFCSPHIGHO2_12_FULL_60_13]|uniref:Protein translocase subunit SecD n=2 Tax=Candidatus Liptoniibacteriota TaxID=1817909 RepID=A0A1G2CE48_9BACT|nr:MAG: protein-export membrane protein SecD [Candidatus Liptonbacteria bacterium RIFCSPHIGHO2_12_FULL_60_13]